MKCLLSLLIILNLGLAQVSNDIEEVVDDVIEAVEDGIDTAVEGIEDGVDSVVDVIEELADDVDPPEPLASMETIHKESNLNTEKFENDEQKILSTDEVLFREDVTIDSGEISETNMRIIGGDLTVYGTVNGKIILFGGDASLRNGSILNGEILTIGGNVYRESNSTVNGKIIENNLSEGLIYRETDKENAIQGTTKFDMDRRSERSHQSWIHPKRAVLQYNRNEGLVFTPFNQRWDRHSKSNFRLNWSVGLRWRKGLAPDYTGRVTFEKSFFENQNLILYTSLFKEARTDDGYRLPEKENSWANFLARQDFYDRWDESGWEAGYGFNLFRNIRFKGRFVSAEQDTLPTWNMTSLFEKTRKLRPYLMFDPKSTNYYEMSVTARTPHYSPLQTGLAVFLQSEYIQAEGDTATVFKMDYGKAIQRNLALMIFNWEFSEGLVFRSRLMIGSGGKDLPSHRLFSVGGLGSVSAQQYKLQQGNQMAQLNLALFLTPRFTDGDWLISFFADGGRAWESGGSWSSGWVSDNPELGISSAGIGIGHGDYDDDFDWMVNIAKPLDHDGPYETTIRFNYAF